MRQFCLRFSNAGGGVGVVALVAALILGTAPLDAEEAPLITIRKGDKVAVSTEGVSGSGRALLDAALEACGAIELKPAAQAGYRAAGSTGRGGVSGRLTDSRGDTVLSKSYDGGLRPAMHQFADDIVEALTGKPGIAASRIAFVSNRTGRKEIYTCDYDGAGIQQLTRDNSISVAPALSRDGGKLAYTGYHSGYADIYLIELASGARQRIVKYPGTNSGAAFSPDGRRIACTISKDGNPELYVVSARGGGAKRLTRSRGAEASPTWGPEGREIIFTSDDRGSPQLFRVSASGGRPRLLSTGYTYCTEPSWSPDGSKVAFNTRSGGSFKIAVLDLRRGGARLLQTSGNCENPVWGADSRHLIYATGSALVRLDTLSGQTTTLVSGMGKISEPAWSH